MSVSDLALRFTGTLVAVVGAVATAVMAAFLTPLYAGTVRLPVAIVVAVAANYALVWFTYRVTEHKLVALLPGLVWMGVMILFSARTSEGDIVLAGNNWVGLATIFTGVAAYAVAAYRLLIPPPPPVRPSPGPPATDRPRAFPPGPDPAGDQARPARPADPPQWSTPR